MENSASGSGERKLISISFSSGAIPCADQRPETMVPQPDRIFTNPQYLNNLLAQWLLLLAYYLSFWSRYIYSNMFFFNNNSTTYMFIRVPVLKTVTKPFLIVFFDQLTIQLKQLYCQNFLTQVSIYNNIVRKYWIRVHFTYLIYGGECS